MPHPLTVVHSKRLARNGLAHQRCAIGQSLAKQSSRRWPNSSHSNQVVRGASDQANGSQSTEKQPRGRRWQRVLCCVVLSAPSPRQRETVEDQIGVSCP